MTETRKEVAYDEIHEEIRKEIADEVAPPNLPTFASLVTPSWTEEEMAKRVVAAMKGAAVSGKGEHADKYYGLVLECRNIVVDSEKRKIATQDAGNIEVRKTAWNVRESDTTPWFWIDTYTLACEDFAVRMLEALGEGPWPIYLPIVFGGQITKVSKGEEDWKDIVTLA